MATGMNIPPTKPSGTVQRLIFSSARAFLMSIITKRRDDRRRHDEWCNRRVENPQNSERRNNR